MRMRSESAFAAHVDRTCWFQHGGNEMPTIEDAETHEKGCLARKKMLDESKARYEKRPDLVEGMMVMEGNAFTSICNKVKEGKRLSRQNITDAIRVGYRYGHMDNVKQMLRDAVKSVMEKPYLWKRGNKDYLQVVEWQKAAKKFLSVCNHKFGITYDRETRTVVG